MKQKKCKYCKNKTYTPIQFGLSWFCSIDCATNMALSNREKSKKIEKRQALKAFSDRDIPTLKRKAQQVFNAYIRARDGKKCISCGYTGEGRQFHSGHFRPAGNCGQLRFDERNVHSQCSICNNYKSGNLAEYRKALIEKIGESEVIALESDNTPKKWTAEELTEIIKTYKAKIKELQ